MTANSTVSRIMALALAGSVLAGSGLSATALAATKKAAPTAKTATPAEPALTREDARKHAAELFDRLDFNHDGVFNAADGKARRDARLGEMFDRIDANHDGQVTKAEFIAAHEAPRGAPADAPKGDTPPPPPGGDHGPMGRGPGGPGHDGPRGPGGPRDEGDRMAFSPMVFAILRAADPQHTGSVTKDAFIAAELKRFDEADANQDGKVTREEMRESRHAHRGWEGRGRGDFRHDGPRGEGSGRGGPDRDGPGPDRRWGRHDDAPPPPPAPDAAK